MLALCAARLLAASLPAAGMVITQVRAETFSSPGLCSVTVDGWVRTVEREGFTYRCISCVDQIEIEILSGPSLGPQAAWHSNDEFIAALDTNEKQRAFAEGWMKPARPDAQNRFEVHHVELAEIGGLRMLVIASKFITGQVVIPEISMVPAHKGRLTRVRVHTKSGALSAEIEKLLDAFLAGLTFEK